MISRHPAKRSQVTRRLSQPVCVRLWLASMPLLDLRWDMARECSNRLVGLCMYAEMRLLVGLVEI